MTSGVVDELRLVETTRCRAISEMDLSTLESLLADELTHTHVTGDTQDKDTYLAALAGKPRRTTATEMAIRPLSDEVAVITGPLENSFELPDGSIRTGLIHALRVWYRRGGSWQLVAFAASGAGGAPPGAPPVAR